MENPDKNADSVQQKKRTTLLTVRCISWSLNTPKCICSQGSALEPTGELTSTPQTPSWLSVGHSVAKGKAAKREGKAGKEEGQVGDTVPPTHPPDYGLVSNCVLFIHSSSDAVIRDYSTSHFKDQ